MPKDLAALLVEDGAVPADVMARAVARQRDVGGALDTALLELSALPEDRLTSYLARAAELPPAPGTAWAGGDARARRVFPSRVAERHGLAPFALEGRELALVATYPVDLGLLDEISFMLSLHLTAHVGPEWRVRELIHRIYGGALPPRLAALAEAAGGVPERTEAPPDEEPGPEARPEPPTTAAALAGFSRDESEPLEPLAAALAEALERVDFPFDDPEPEAPAAPAAEEPTSEQDPEPEAPAAPPDRTAPPHWKLADARAAMGAARHRDEVVLTALRYARDFFEFAAMFAVTRDAVAGHDALGGEEARDHARTVAIWSSDPGIFKTVIETQSPYLGPVALGVAGTDAVLRGLCRTPRTVLVYPVMLRDRPVCILYADNGEAPVSARRLGDLLLFLSTVGGAFERIIRDRNRRRRRAPPSAPAEAASAAREPSPAPTVAPAPDAGAQPPPQAPSPHPSPPLRGGEGELLPSFARRGGPSPAAPRGGTALEWPALTTTAPAETPVGEWAASAPPESPLEDVPAPPAAAEPPPSEPTSAVEPAAAADSLAALEDQFFSASGEAPAEAPPAIEAAPAPAPARVAPPRPAAPQPPPRSHSAPAPAPAAPPAANPPDPATLAAIADRALDADPEVASAACTTLGNRRREPSARQATEKLRRALLSGISARASRAARAIGALRDPAAIPLLIQVLETSEPETAQASADALAAITLQRLGPDARRWLGWWKENRGRGRAEWLFSGLTSADRETRVAASVELSHAAPPPVVYTADLPAADREKAARAWAGWWSRSGHVL